LLIIKYFKLLRRYFFGTLVSAMIGGNSSAYAVWPSSFVVPAKDIAVYEISPLWSYVDQYGNIEFQIRFKVDELGEGSMMISLVPSPEGGCALENLLDKKDGICNILEADLRFMIFRDVPQGIKDSYLSIDNTELNDSLDVLNSFNSACKNAIKAKKSLDNFTGSRIVGLRPDPDLYDYNNLKTQQIESEKVAQDWLEFIINRASGLSN
jgi:hypothetical protein